ncbi:MAG: sensor histidine kinase [Halodesulfurarchaeum sp.]
MMRFSVELVGTAMLALSVLYVETAGKPFILAVAEVSLPFLIGILVVGYGAWLRHKGMKARELIIVAAAHLVGIAVLVMATTWLLFVARLEFVLPRQTLFVVLNGAGLGAVTGGIVGALYVRVRRQQAMLRRRNRALSNQNARLDQFASIVSHDLRNPLNVAKGRLELIETTSETPDLQAIEGALDRMDAIISDMLTFARQGKIVEETETVDLEDVARSAWDSVETGSVALTIDEPLVLRADTGRLRQALENLFRNAVEHGGDSVSRVAIGRLEDGFHVEDDGQGIDPDHRDQVFQSAFSTTPDGTGFGLAIVRAVAEAHGWEVSVAEGTEGGARFEFHAVELVHRGDERAD